MIYTPKESAPFSIVVFVHGGDLDTVDVPLRSLANRSGCTIVSVDYPLIPEHPFPTLVESVYLATKWIVARAAAFGGDPMRVAIAGDSCGANLATAATPKASTLAGLPPAFIVTAERLFRLTS